MTGERLPNYAFKLSGAPQHSALLWLRAARPQLDAARKTDADHALDRRD